MSAQTNEDVISAEPFAPSISGSDDKMSEKEKGAEHVDGVRIQVEEEKGDTLVDVHTHIYDGVKRKMHQRHLQMMALTGTIGVGLFLNSGKAIAHGGPAGALLAYGLVGTIAYCMLMSLGEMAVYAPISGSYIHFAERWLHPSAGFALGWQMVFSGTISVPNELVAGSVIISYWDPTFTKAHQAAYMTALMILCAGINYFGVRWFGESEFIFAMIKICLIVGLIIAGLIVDLGGVPSQPRIGFKYWRDPGAFAPYVEHGAVGKFLGWFADIVTATQAYIGTEGIVIAAAEVKNPRVSITRAVKRVFYRIALFYIVGILIVGMLVPYTNKSLAKSKGTAASSPFVIAFELAKIKVLPSIVNAGVLTSAFSSGNTSLYHVSRQLYGLALRGQAPKFFAKTTKNGLPITALMFPTVFMPLCFLALGSGASTVLNWFSNLTALSGFIVWGTICSTYLRFKKGVKAQGIDRRQFRLANRFQPWPAYWVIFWAVTIILCNGWQNFTKGNFVATSFVIAYLNLPVFLLLILIHWIVKRPRWLAPIELDFVSNIPSDEEVSYEEPPPKNWFIRIVRWLFT